MWTFAVRGFNKSTISMPSQVCVSMSHDEVQDLVTILRVAMGQGLEHPIFDQQFCTQIAELAETAPDR